MNQATHRLFQSASPALWADILEGTQLPMHCLNEAGDDLLFSALTHPHVLAQAKIEAASKTAHSSSAKDAQAALVALAQRPETDPLAQRSVRLGTTKKSPVLVVSNLELAVRLSLVDVALALLAHPNLTPEALGQRIHQPTPWHAQGLLALAVERDLSPLVGPLATAGWDIEARDVHRQGLVAAARSPAMVHAMVAAGLDRQGLEAPGLMEVLTKRVKRTELPAVVEAIVSHSENSPINDGQRAFQWLRSAKDTDPNEFPLEHVKEREQATQKLRARQEEWRQMCSAASIPPHQWRTRFGHGTLKGDLTIPAMLARLVQEDRDNAAFGFVQGMEAQVFAGPAQDIAPGVPDYGVWALWVPTAEAFEDRNIEEDQTPGYARWVNDVKASLKTIEALHAPEQWLAWKTQAAVTLSRRPTSLLINALHQWSCDLIEELNTAKNAATSQGVTKTLEALESLIVAGVIFQGRYLTDAVRGALDGFSTREGHDLAAAQGVRDRVLLACLGNEERFKDHAISNGITATEPLKDSARDAQAQDLFLPANAAQLLANPSLVPLIQKGLKRALTLNYPNAQAMQSALRAIALDDRLPEPDRPAAKSRF